MTLQEAKGGRPGGPLGAGSRDRQLGLQLLLGSSLASVLSWYLCTGTFRVSSHRVPTFPLGSGLRSLIKAGETKVCMRVDRFCVAQWSAAGLSCQTGPPWGQ